ncbi:MAG TPA: TonB family protein [Terracidiphilus sp.]|jgi:TonB family protein|nr:TonB family protein [Terracidiphilus sp.]
MSGPIISPGWVGRVVDGRFALHECLGQSASSCVFRTDLPQPIPKRAAIKLIAAEGARADAYLSSWAKAANLTHPHLMRVYRSGRFQFGTIQLVYVVTECADEVLSQILPQRALTADETREMLGPVLEALAYVHGKGFVHGHIKPSNILVVDDVVKLSGDNLAAGGVRNRFAALSPHDAPEVSEGVLTPASDVWSLGITLAETLTQRTPTLDRTSTRDVVLPEGLPRAFAEIARNCLQRDPASRSALSEIQAQLAPGQPIAFPGSKGERVAPASGLAAPVRDRSVDEESEPPTKKRGLVLGIGLVAVVALFAVLMMRNLGHRDATGSTISENATTQAPSAAPGGSAESAQTQTAPPEPPSRRAPAPRPRAGSGGTGAVVERKMPSVTDQARRTIHGTISVAVRADVDANGKVADASFQSEGPSRYFAKAAMAAARQWTFTPTPSHWVIHFKFRQGGDEATAVEQTR